MAKSKEILLGKLNFWGNVYRVIGIKRGGKTLCLCGVTDFEERVITMYYDTNVSHDCWIDTLHHEINHAFEYETSRPLFLEEVRSAYRGKLQRDNGKEIRRLENIKHR